MVTTEKRVWACFSMVTIYNHRVQFRTFFKQSLFSFWLMGAVSGSQANEQNLVTILLPAPIESVDDEFYPRLTSARGMVDLRLNESVFQGFGLKRSHLQLENARTDYARMRAIGFRIDPCFRFVATDRCQAQLRVVWQAFSDGIADDVAMHTFHRIESLADFKSLLDSSRALDRSSNVQDSPVHPHFLKYGMVEIRGQRFLQTIRRLVAAYPAHEVAVQTLEDDTSIHWGFQHFKMMEGQSTGQLIIQKIQALKQTFKNWARPIDFVSVLVPHISPIFGNLEFFKNSVGVLPTMTVSQRRQFVRQVGRVLDANQEPFHGEIDCVSCHIAPAVRDVLENRAERSTVRLRMLGYHRNQPVISDRVRSETDRILRRYSRELNPN